MLIVNPSGISKEYYYNQVHISVKKKKKNLKLNEWRMLAL